VEEQYRNYTVPINPWKSIFLTLRHDHKSVKQDPQKAKSRLSFQPIQNSSPSVQKIKSVCCSGTKSNLVWVPSRYPFPNSPPDPIAILDWVDIPSHTQRINVWIKKHHDSILLMLGKAWWWQSQDCRYRRSKLPRMSEKAMIRWGVFLPIMIKAVMMTPMPTAK